MVERLLTSSEPGFTTHHTTAAKNATSRTSPSMPIAASVERTHTIQPMSGAMPAIASMGWIEGSPSASHAS